MTIQPSSVETSWERVPSGSLDVAKLRLQLSEVHLAKLIDDGLVKIREDNVAVKGPNFDRGRPLKRAVVNRQT
jgi:hypothetical protein